MNKVAHLKQKDAPPPTIVEGTAGNTGIGLVHICNSLGFQCHLFMPNNQSKEKIDYLQSLGARINQFPVAPFNDPNNYNNKAKEYAANTPNAYWTNQFDNIQNRQAHIETTGQTINIWKSVVVAQILISFFLKKRPRNMEANER